MLVHSMGWAFRKLDDAGTFHGMGVQKTGWCWNIPWDGHYRCGHSWHKTSQSHTPRSHCNSRDGVMHHGQSLYTLFWCFRRQSVIGLRGGAAELHWWRQKQDILHSLEDILALIQAGLGCCRVCATGCILVRVLSFPKHYRYGPSQQELHIPTLISGTTLWSHNSSYLESHDGHWQWATWLSHGPSSYRLGDFTQKWAFVAAWDDWRQDLAFNNRWKWSLLRILSHTYWLARPSPEQIEDIFLQMLHLMLNSIEREQPLSVKRITPYRLIMRVYDAKTAECF